MKFSKLAFLVMAASLTVSCKFKSSSDGKDGVKVTSPQTNNAIKGAIISNDIDLDVTGIKLKKAYLVDANEKPLAINEAALGERIYVIVELDTGWVKENKKSFIGASERISTSAGKVVVSADDIFKDYETTGLDPEDAKFIKLSAVITQADPGVDDFVVNFRLWDKKGSGEVKGKYKFSLKK